MIYPTDRLEETTLYYLPKISTNSRAIYLTILLFVFLSFGISPFIYTDISIRSGGIIRPKNERVEMRAMVGGMIDSVYCKDGDSIHQGDLLLVLKDPSIKSKLKSSTYQCGQLKMWIQDLTKLCSATSVSEYDFTNIQSSLYKEQLSRFIHQKENQEAGLRKAEEELSINNKLALDKVISRKELFDSKNNYEKTNASYHAYLLDQQNTWQQDLNRYQVALLQQQETLDALESDAKYKLVKAPISGIVQGLSSKYPGVWLQPNELLCNISPNDQLIGECYVASKDIGFLKIGQSVQYQIEAFDYNYFGFVKGQILAIDNDYTLISNAPVFKVKCGFDNRNLSLKNGYQGQLKKGLKFQARFKVANRSLWQLLFDKLDDWLNPIKSNDYSTQST